MRGGGERGEGRRDTPARDPRFGASVYPSASIPRNALRMGRVGVVLSAVSGDLDALFDNSTQCWDTDDGQASGVVDGRTEGAVML